VVPSYILLNKTLWEGETARERERERETGGKLSRGDIYEVYYKYDFRTPTHVMCVCVCALRRFSTDGRIRLFLFSAIYLI